jgi:ABC-type hemin transport system ATPase subunit
MFGLTDRQSVERLEFSNGYTASVAKYAGEYQIAVLFNGKICYDTPVTNDVVRCETMAKVYLVLLEISALPKREG